MNNNTTNQGPSLLNPDIYDLFPRTHYLHVSKPQIQTASGSDGRSRRRGFLMGFKIRFIRVHQRD